MSQNLIFTALGLVLLTASLVLALVLITRMRNALKMIETAQKRAWDQFTEFQKLAGDLQAARGGTGPQAAGAPGSGTESTSGEPVDAGQHLSEPQAVQNAAIPSEEKQNGGYLAQGPDQGRRSSPAGGDLKQIYFEWCTANQRPALADTYEVSPLRFAASESTNELARPTYLFADHPQTGEFLRFSEPGSAEGLAFPHPDARFDESVHRILFPDLNAQHFHDPRQLAGTDPVRIQRRDDGTWQKVS